MLILPKTCFLHIPKSGGSWVKKALIESRIECYEFTTIDGSGHIGLKDCPCPNKFKFAFVRHPVDMYRSYWQYKMTYGWDQNNPMDVECKSDNFHSFIRCLLFKFPGAYSQWVINFVGEGKNEIEFVGKYENLVDDLIVALTIAGESFDEQFIRNYPPYNVSDKINFPASYTTELEAEIREADAAIIQRFNYT
jgi:hypothetical protein